MIILNRRRVLVDKGLPYDAELEWIDSNTSGSNKNRINTEIIPNSNTHTIRFILSVSFSSIQRYIVASNYKDNTGKPSIALELYVLSSLERLRTYSTSNGASANLSNIDSVSIPIDTFIDIDSTIDFDNLQWNTTFEFNNVKYTFNGTVYNTTYNCVDPILLFLDHRTTHVNDIAHPLKIRYALIIVDNVLVRDFIPVRKNITGYMYDKVSKKLFGNSGTGNFLLGLDIVPIKYLESTGTQWIDTNVDLNNIVSMTADIAISKTITANGIVFGAYYDNQSYPKFQVYINNSCKWGNIYTTGNKGLTYSGFTVGNTVSINTRYSPVITTKGIQGSNVKILIFARNNDIGDNLPIDGLRLYSAKITYGNIVIRDFIPVRVGQIGYLYDKVSSRLFANLGTGDFVLGPDKVLPYDELLPSLTIASGQTPAIITDYYPNQNTKFVFSCKITTRPTSAAYKVMYGTFTFTNNTLSKRVDFLFRDDYFIRTKFGSESGLLQVSYALDTKYDFEVGNNYITQDGITTSYTTTGQFVTDYPLVLFSNCNNGTPSIVNTPANGFVGVIYGSFDIYEGTTLVRSYRPVKKDGRVGLYESVTNQMLFSPYGEFSE